jgi:hypothetical protein
LATADLGVAHPPGALWAAVFTLSEADAVPGSASPAPAAADNSNALRRSRRIEAAKFSLILASPHNPGGSPAHHLDAMKYLDAVLCG